ncbi:hypothetical protein MKX01_022863, partial [Papaver californicum]
MRALDEAETIAVFEKLFKFTGNNLKNIIEKPSHEGTDKEPGRITENTVAGDGGVVFSMTGVPLGFGISAKSTQDCRKLDPNGIVVLHQSDI